MIIAILPVLGLFAFISGGSLLMNFLYPPKELPNHVQKAIKGSPDKLHLMLLQARTELGIDQYKYNYAIIGCSGVGKSTLVNAFCNRRDYDIGASPVGETETTSRVIKFPHPEYPTINLFDFPGTGTMKHPAESYFYHQHIYSFDFLILVTAGRFTQNDIGLAKEAERFNQPFAFIRNKVLHDAKRAKKRGAGTKEAAIIQVRNQVKRELREQLQTANIAAPHIFCIDTDEMGHKLLDGSSMVEFILQTTWDNRSKNQQ